MASVTLKNVSKVYRGRRGEQIAALKGLDLEVADRSFTVLLGPSGCGKTTALRIIAGLESPTSGTVDIGGRDVVRLPPGDRDVTMVFQNYALYPHLTAGDNIAFGLRVRRLPEAETERRVHEAAAILGITDLLRRRPRELSGGQQQRVALGRAIVRNPRVFLFDEPLSNLDAKMRAQMRAELIKLHQRLRATIIYVTHDQSEAMTMATDLALLREGRIEQRGLPLDLYRQPANTYVAGFLGSPSMNFVHGAVRAGADCPSFVEDGGGSLELELPSRWAGLAGRRIILGIRPEHLQPLSANEPLGTNSFPAHLDIVELTGAESICYLQTGANTLISRSRSQVDAREAGHRLHFRADLARLCFFEPETGKRID